jgi:hypothetical protein
LGASPAHIAPANGLLTDVLSVGVQIAVVSFGGTTWRRSIERTVEHATTFLSSGLANIL